MHPHVVELILFLVKSEELVQSIQF